MALKKDKQKVLNETIDDSRLGEFFDLTPPAHVDADYHILERAYRGLQAADFSRFITLFIKQGHNINASGEQGTLLNIASQHAHGGEYAAVLKEAGAE